MFRPGNELIWTAWLSEARAAFELAAFEIAGAAGAAAAAAAAARRAATVS